MAKLYIFGTCSGTEPMPDRHQTSFAIEANGSLYWFDAGECCAYTACMMGLDLLKIKTITISHPHADHIGGLPHLFFTIGKIGTVTKRVNPPVDIYTPCMTSYEGTVQMMDHAEGAARRYEKRPHLVKDGLVFDDGVMKVTAFHNHHLPQLPDGSWESFTYRIEAEGKTVVFSGDVKGFEDLSGALQGGCDLLLMETGHHKVADVCAFFEESPVKKLIFVHHGREILNSYEDCRRLTDACRKPAFIAEDRDIVELS